MAYKETRKWVEKWVESVSAHFRCREEYSNATIDTTNNHQHNELSTILTTYRVVVVVVVVEGEAATLRLADCSRNRSLLMSVTRVVAMSNKPS